MDQHFLDSRLALLTLHRALLNAERAVLEAERGSTIAPGEFLQLLINDQRFVWIKPLSAALVQMDEALDAVRKGVEEPEGKLLLSQLRLLLESESDGSEFAQRYLELVQDPAVLMAHQALFNILDAR
jgi:hypothetical protein